MISRETRDISITSHVAQIEHLIEMQNQIKDELEHTINSLLTLKILDNITYYISNAVTKDDVLDIVVEGKFIRKFQRRDRTNDEFDNWNGEFKFSYGDIMFDNKVDEFCVVLYETHQFVTLWYFEENNPPGTIKKRMKYDRQLEMRKRMLSY